MIDITAKRRRAAPATAPPARTPFQIALDAEEENSITTSPPKKNTRVNNQTGLLRDTELVSKHPMLGFLVRLSQWAFANMAPETVSIQVKNIILPGEVTSWIVNITISHQYDVSQRDSGAFHPTQTFTSIYFHTVATSRCCDECVPIAHGYTGGSIIFTLNMATGKRRVADLVVCNEFLRVLGSYDTTDFMPVVRKIYAQNPSFPHFLG